MRDPGLTPRAIHLSPPPGARTLNGFAYSWGSRPRLIIYCRSAAFTARSRIGLPFDDERRRRGRYIAWGVSPRFRCSTPRCAPGGGDRSFLRREPRAKYLSRLRRSTGSSLASPPSSFRVRDGAPTLSSRPREQRERAEGSMGCVRVCRIHHRLVLSEAEGRVEWIPRFASLTRDDTRGRACGNSEIRTCRRL